MDKTKDLIVEIEEKYGEECFGDFCNINSNIKSTRRPQGHVEIYELNESGEKQLVGKSNLVVYTGRELVGVRLIGANVTEITPTKDEYISWLGLGSGGVSVGDPFTAISPTSSDTDLATEIPISATDTDCADLHDGAYYKCPLDSLEIEQDSYNDDRWLVLKSITTIDVGYANGYQISEAGLFTSESVTPGYAGPFNLFARVTFESIIKVTSRRLILIWYIYV